ncbi:MAG: FeoB-associated Cys-rich membrane protein [Clostridia bacterium]|nr:FeoB-associated Cys-rich membrane protein [Clostridia bacterium]
MNFATAMICIGLCAAVFLIVRVMIRDKRSGKACSGCSGNCAGCSGCDHH